MKQGHVDFGFTTDSVPGIGIIISMELLVELQDMWRFESGRFSTRGWTIGAG